MPTENSVQEVDLIQLLQIFLKHKVVILSLCILGALLLLGISYAIPVTYKSSMTLVPVENNEELNPASLGGNGFSNLANLAGINLGSQSSSIKINIEIIKSRRFILDFINSHELELDLIAAKHWSRNSNTIEYDEDIFNTQTQDWVIEDEYRDGHFRAPTDLEIYQTFMTIYSVKLDSDTGLLSVSLKHISPFIAQSWLEKLVKFANTKIRETELLESEKKMEYLSEKMDKTRIESIRSIFYQLIESELQNKMLIDTRQEFAYKTIDPPFIPEEKFAPKRLYYLVLGGISSFILIFVYLLFSLVFSSYRKSFVNE